MEHKTQNTLTPLVTIITASFCLIKNGRKDFLAQNIQSVQNQTYKNIEHIVIDGASTDGTLELLEYYQNQGAIKYYSEPDKGIYDAMNKGILKANGKYVVCLNSDDFYCSDRALEYLVSQAEAENADACYANARRIHPGTQELIKRWCGSDHFSPWKSYFPCHQTFLIKTDVMKELGLYDLSYKVSADNNFLLRMVQHNKKFTYVDKDVISFRDGGFSKSHSQIGRQDRVTGLYAEYGQFHGLTLSDCSNLIGNHFLTLPSEDAIQLGRKLEKKEWIEDYFNQLTSGLSHKRANTSLKEEPDQQQTGKKLSSRNHRKFIHHQEMQGRA